MKTDDPVWRFVQESNRIEGIIRPPTEAEVEAHYALLERDALSVSDLCSFVSVVAGKPLRNRRGMNVRVGQHIPPEGGPEIEHALKGVLGRVNRGDHPYHVHCDYETLHPFLDGNGRSGRALWLWMMLRRGEDRALRIGFLHCWYYQSLDALAREAA